MNSITAGKNMYCKNGGDEITDNSALSDQVLYYKEVIDMNIHVFH